MISGRERRGWTTRTPSGASVLTISAAPPRRLRRRRGEGHRAAAAAGDGTGAVRYSLDGGTTRPRSLPWSRPPARWSGRQRHHRHLLGGLAGRRRPLPLQDRRARCSPRAPCHRPRGAGGVGVGITRRGRRRRDRRHVLRRDREPRPPSSPRASPVVLAHARPGRRDAGGGRRRSGPRSCSAHGSRGGTGTVAVAAGEPPS